MGWKIGLQKDVIKGNWLEGYGAFVYWEFYYVIARNGKRVYIHRRVFKNDWDNAKKFCVLLSGTEQHPYEVPGDWARIRDTKAITEWDYRSCYEKGVGDWRIYLELLEKNRNV